MEMLDGLDPLHFSGRTILVTGASGLVGSHFLKLFSRLRSVGIQIPRITAVTRSGKFAESNSDLSELDVRVGDLGDWRFVEALPESDLVIHSAGYGQPGKFLHDPFLTMKLNTEVTERLLKKTIGGGEFLFLSTSEVYSGLKTPPFSEHQIGTTNTNHPRAPYIEAKRCGETYVVIAQEQQKIRSVAVRLALAYGPGVKHDDSRVLNEFVRAGLSKRQIKLRDSGNAMRTYVFISDAIRMMVAVLVRGSDSIYNIGGTSRVSILELANCIGKLTESEVILPENECALIGAPEDVYLDLTETLKFVKQKNFVDLETGLSRTIQWHRGIR